MSEQYIPDSGGDLPILIDPAVQRSLDQMREFQAELDLQPNTPSHRVSEMLQELDLNWPHMNELVNVSGNVRSAVVDVQEEQTEFGETHSKLMTMMREDGAQQLCRYFARDVEFTSRGFIADTEPFMVGGHQLGIHTVLYVMLSRYVYVNVPDSESPIQCILNTSASADEVSMEFLRDSIEYNRINAQEYFPEFMAEVDARIDGTQRVADDIMALKGLEATINPDIITDSEVLTLETYLDELINVGQEDMPFLMKVQVGTVLYDPSDKADALADYDDEPTLMMRVLGVRLSRKTETYPNADGGYVTSVNPNIIEARIAIQLLGRDSEDDSVEVEIRLTDILGLTNVRQSFYDQDEYGEDGEVENHEVFGEQEDAQN